MGIEEQHVSTWIAALAVGAAVVLAVHRIKKEIRMSAQETVDAVVAQLGKAKEEIVAKIAELEAANPGVDLSALTEIAQGLDDVVPDVVEEPAEPVEETPAE